MTWRCRHVWVVFAAFVLVAVLMLPGCLASLSGLMDSDPARARGLGLELTQRYEQLHESYEQLQGTLPQEAGQTLAREVAPKLNQLKRLIMDYNTAVLAWSRGDTGQQDVAAALYRAIKARVLELSDLLLDTKVHGGKHG